MLKIVEEQAINKINKINKMKNTEIIKTELYSIFVILILSKNQFINNIEIKNFLSDFNISFKEYVYYSRTMILARTLREIEKANEFEINEMKFIFLNKFYINKKETKYSKSRSLNDDYLSSVLEKYTRNEN